MNSNKRTSVVLQLASASHRASNPPSMHCSVESSLLGAGRLNTNVFDDPENDLAMDFWKRDVGIDIAFNHRSFIGRDLLRLQAAAEVKTVIKVGVYICPTKEFAKDVSAKDGSSMVVFERTKWYLENFKPVLTAPILLVGLTG